MMRTQVQIGQWKNKHFPNFRESLGGLRLFFIFVTMQMTQEKISEYFSDEKNLFMVWNENDTFPGNEQYFPVDYLSLCISLSGSIDFYVDTRHRHADKDHIQFFVKDLSVKIVNR